MSAIANPGPNNSTMEWIAAIAIAVAVHGGVYWWSNNNWQAPATAAGLGQNGIEIDLGASGTLAGGVESAIQPQEVLAEEVQQETVAEVQTVEAEAVQAQPEAVEAVVEEVETLETTEVVETKAVDVVKPVPKPTEPPVEVVKSTQPVEQKVAKPAETVQETVAEAVKAEETQTAKAPTTENSDDADANITEQSTEGQAGESYSDVQGETTGDGKKTSGGGIPGEVRSYYATLQAILDRNKDYPRRAKRRGIEGIVQLWFRMNRDGKVLDFKIHESSGNRLLDRSVERLIKKVSPLPPFPREMSKETIALVVPIYFRID